MRVFTYTIYMKNYTRNDEINEKKIEKQWEKQKQKEKDYNLALTSRIINMFEFASDADPTGSYTGTCTIGDPQPEQDADDL